MYRFSFNIIIQYWLPVVLYCGFIYWQSANPCPAYLPKFSYADKLYHVIGYAVLGALIYRALAVTWKTDNNFMLIGLSVLFTGLYGISDELHQLFVVYRTASIGDVAADCIGGFIGASAYHKLNKIDYGKAVKSLKNRFFS